MLSSHSSSSDSIMCRENSIMSHLTRMPILPDQDPTATTTFSLKYFSEFRNRNLLYIENRLASNLQYSGPCACQAPIFPILHFQYSCLSLPSTQITSMYHSRPLKSLITRQSLWGLRPKLINLGGGYHKYSVYKYIACITFLLVVLAYSRSQLSLAAHYVKIMSKIDFTISNGWKTYKKISEYES